MFMYMHKTFDDKVKIFLFAQRNTKKGVGEKGHLEPLGLSEDKTFQAKLLIIVQEYF